jgi:hypothetical protein
LILYLPNPIPTSTKIETDHHYLLSHHDHHHFQGRGKAMEEENEKQLLLLGGYEKEKEETIFDGTIQIPIVPSPIVGGVFLPVKQFGGGAKLNPDIYDPMSNLIVLFVTIFATILFGIQLGLGAFLFDYIGHVLIVSGASSGSGSGSSLPIPIPLPFLNKDNFFFIWDCLLMMVFWTSLTFSYWLFSNYLFHFSLRLFHLFYFSFFCMISSFGILFGAEIGFLCFIFCLIGFGFTLAPLFTLNIYCLTRIINEALIRRVSSLIVFGCGMGEIFIPVLMGFFMGDYSGQMYGSVAVSYITFILSICLVGVSGVLLIMVKKKLKAVERRLLATISSRSSSSSTSGGGMTGIGFTTTTGPPHHHHHHHGRGGTLLPVHEQYGYGGEGSPSCSIGSSSSSRRSSFGSGILLETGGLGGKNTSNNNGPRNGGGIRRSNGGFY